MKTILTTILIFIAIDLTGWILLWQYEFWTGEKAAPGGIAVSLTGSILAATIISVSYLAENRKSINK